MVERIVRFLALVVLAFVTTNCGQTLFRSNFDQTPIGQPPAPMQGVGTATTQGSVIVVALPQTPSRWARMNRPVPDTDLAAFQGNFSAAPGDGEYTFTTTVFMSSGNPPLEPPPTGIATIAFRRAGQPVGDPGGFLHLDLMPDNTVRIDDVEASKFGGFPRDAPFIVQVTLDIQPSSATAHIVLSGAGAEGTKDHIIPTALLNQARQFGNVRLSMDFPHLGQFHATNIVVRRD